jgi:hypothetical protein
MIRNGRSAIGSGSLLDPFKVAFRLDITKQSRNRSANLSIMTVFRRRLLPQNFRVRTNFCPTSL